MAYFGTENSPSIHGTDAANNIRHFLAQHTATDAADWWLLLRARHGLQLVCTTINEEKSARHIVTQAFTCLTAVNPILAAGMHPIYADISAENLAIDSEKLQIPPHTGAVILQNTFGIVANFAAQEIAEKTHQAGALLIEDSAHCLGRMARNAAGAPVADISIHSFGAEKMLPTKFGAAIWLNPHTLEQKLRQKLQQSLENLTPPGPSLQAALRLYKTQDKILSHLPARLSAKTRHLFENTPLFYPPITSQERNGESAAIYALDSWAGRKAATALQNLPAIEAQLATTTDIYLRELENQAGLKIPLAIESGMPLLRFPMLVQSTAAGVERDPEELFTYLQGQGFYPGRWYRPLLFPGTPTAERYDLPAQYPKIPTTRRIAASIINLRTQENPNHALRLAIAVKDWMNKKNI